MNMKMKSKQQLPKWFEGELSEEGAVVTNPFSGEKYELSRHELSMYDFIMGAQMAFESGLNNSKMVKDFQRGLDWFRKNNAKAYMVLLD